MNHKRQALSLFLLIVIAAGSSPRQLAAQLTPAGPETRVDTETLPPGQFPDCPKIGVAPDHSFEIAWDYRHRAPSEVKARHYDASGSPTDPSEILAAHLDYYATLVDVSPVSTGFRLLIRTLPRPNGGFEKFFRRDLDADGVPAGAPRPLSTAPTTDWISPGRPGETIFAITDTTKRWSVQKLNANGKPTGKPYILNSRPIYTQQFFSPVIASLPGGRWVAVFAGQTGPQPYFFTGEAIRARLFNAKGPVGSDFDVASVPPGPSQLLPRLSHDPVIASHSSGFAISWSSVGDRRAETLHVRFYNAMGVPEGDTITVGTNDHYMRPHSAAFDDTGRLLLLWAEGAGQNGRDADLRAQIFLSDGQPAGPSFYPHSSASGELSGQRCGSAAWAGDSWVITWLAGTEDFTSDAIFVRQFQ